VILRGSPLVLAQPGRVEVFLGAGWSRRKSDFAVSGPVARVDLAVARLNLTAFSERQVFVQGVSTPLQEAGAEPGAGAGWPDRLRQFRPQLRPHRVAGPLTG
jgi:hypothetical protein